jgi:ABC-type dipeptide/oligopeptide/nickel transport system permease component
VAWQASSILLLAVLAGMPLGVAGGRWAWSSFASSLGVVPVTVIPAPALLAGALVLLIAGNLLTALPATVAARTRPAALLRTE